MDALESPILTHSQAWADTIPQRLLAQVTVARLANMVQKKETATDVEVAIFIYTRSLEAPMSSEWADIYFHITCKVLEQYFGENHWDDIKAPKDLDDYSINYLLGPLRKHIYEKRRKILKQRMKEAETTKSASTEKPGIVDGHYTLWDS